MTRPRRTPPPAASSAVDGRRWGWSCSSWGLPGFFELVRAHLRPGGELIINVGHPSSSTALERVVSATLRAVFPHVAREPAEPTNTLLLAGSAPLEARSLEAARGRLAPELRTLDTVCAARLGPALAGGEVYTDDRAPVEWLVDASLLGYATGR